MKKMPMKAEKIKNGTSTPEQIDNTVRLKVTHVRNDEGSDGLEPFWSFDVDGKVIMKRTDVYRYLHEVGFGLISLDEKLVKVRTVNNLVWQVERAEISQELLKFIRKQDIPDRMREAVEETLRTKIRGLLSTEQLELMDEIGVNFKSDTPTASLFYYKNVYVTVEARKVSSHKYNSLDQPIWKSKRLNRNIDYLGLDIEKLLEQSEFAQFVYRVCGEDHERYFGLCSLIGYLLHEYRNPSTDRAVVFMDENIADTPEGGTGKSLVVQALSKIREMAKQDGKNFKYSDKFRFQDVKFDTSLFAINDVHRGFTFEDLFSAITDGLVVEAKGKTRFHIPFEETPKIVITTNYAIKDPGNSHKRRKVEFEFSSHYNGELTPYDEFGHNLFEDWQGEFKDQWNQFDNFMIACVQFYLENGIIEVDQINISINKLRRTTGPDFIEFASELQTNIKHFYRDIVKRFEELHPEVKGNGYYSEQKFSRWLRWFAEAKGYNFFKDRENNTRYFIYESLADPKKVQEVLDRIQQRDKKRNG